MPTIKIKQEPRDWPEEFEQKPQVDATTVVKRELVYNEENEAGSNSGNEDLPMYTPLTCELCKETFTVPGEWVRHIENHAETPQTVPKKRRRTEVGAGYLEKKLQRDELNEPLCFIPGDDQQQREHEMRSVQYVLFNTSCLGQTHPGYAHGK